MMIYLIILASFTAGFLLSSVLGSQVKEEKLSQPELPSEFVKFR